MARKPLKKTVSRNDASGLALKPGLITVAVALGWGALNEPAGLTGETLTIWLLAMGAVAAGTHAAQALGAPLLRLLIGQCQAAIQQVRSAPKS